MTLPDLSPEQEARKKRVCEAFALADDTLHKELRHKWEGLYRQYRTYQEQKAYLHDVPDRDRRVHELVAEWGSDLRLPYAFSTVETIVPRQLSNRPKMLYLPRDNTAIRNVENMRMTVDAQQEQIAYQLRCQTTAKTGQMYGLGVQKVMWRFEQPRKSFELVPATGNRGFEWTAAPVSKAFDDPDVQDVDPFDFLWDPAADSIENCEWVIHRTWRSARYVLGKIREAQAFLAKNPGALESNPDMVLGWPLAVGLDEDAVRGLGSTEKFNEVWAERMRARGFTSWEQRGNQLHEVLEFHDGERVITVLDRMVPVRDVANPSWHGDLPFHIYRPSEVPHEFVGIGAIEPARDLFFEMDALRSQRRDAASLALTPVMAYQDGVIDPAHLQIYPGAAIPVLGEPDQLLRRVQLGDVPHSGYAEEDRIKADIERTTGLGDVVMGAATTGGGTATEAQLQLAAANVRIQNMTLRFELEVIEGVCQHIVELNQQHITAARGYAREVPAPGQPDRRYQWFEVGPQELAGEMFAKCTGGSTAMENVQQNRSDAGSLMALRGDPNVDQRKLTLTILEKLGVPQADAYLAPDQSIPPATLDVLGQMLVERTGAPPEEVQQLLMAAVEVARAVEEQESGEGAPPQMAEAA